MTTTAKTSITGRDAYIESQAFVLAIGHIQSLPREQQARSDMNDMCKIARIRFYPGSLAVHAVNFYRLTGTLVDFFPDDDV